MLIISGAHSVALQWHGYIYALPEVEADQSLAPAFGWLNQNSSPESVVLSDYATSHKIAAYTHNNVYIAPTAGNYFSEKGRLIHGFFVFLSLEYGKTGESFMQQQPDFVSQRLYGQFWRQHCGRYECIPQSVLEQIAHDYRVWKIHSLEEQLFRYRVDYILWDTQRHPTWAIETFPWVKLVLDGERFRLYNVNQSYAIQPWPLGWLSRLAGTWRPIPGRPVPAGYFSKSVLMEIVDDDSGI